MYPCILQDSKNDVSVSEFACHFILCHWTSKGTQSILRLDCPKGPGLPEADGLARWGGCTHCRETSKVTLSACPFPSWHLLLGNPVEHPAGAVLECSSRRIPQHCLGALLTPLHSQSWVLFYISRANPGTLEMQYWQKHVGFCFFCFMQPIKPSCSVHNT